MAAAEREKSSVDTAGYGRFVGFVVKTVLVVMLLASIWIAIATAEGVTSFVAAVVWGFVLSLPYGILVLAVVLTVGWGGWRILGAWGMPIWSAVVLTSVLGALVLAIGMSELALLGLQEPPSGYDRLVFVLWFTGRTAIVAVPAGLFVAWRTYGRLS